jgi:hypothetical protein
MEGDLEDSTKYAKLELEASHMLKLSRSDPEHFVQVGSEKCGFDPARVNVFFSIVEENICTEGGHVCVRECVFRVVFPVR